MDIWLGIQIIFPAGWCIFFLSMSYSDFHSASVCDGLSLSKNLYSFEFDKVDQLESGAFWDSMNKKSKSIPSQVIADNVLQYMGDILYVLCYSKVHATFWLLLSFYMHRQCLVLWLRQSLHKNF